MRFSILALLPWLAMAAPEENQTLHLYSSRHYDSDKALYQAFEQESGIKVEAVEGKADVLIERLKREGENTQADVLILADFARLWRASEAGLFTPITDTALLDKVDSNLRDDQNRWLALTKRARVIVYNKAQGLPDGLKRYEDLANPAYQGMICTRSVEEVYNQSLLASLLAEMGHEKTLSWVKGYVANFKRKPQGNDVDQIRAVAQGICRVALVNTYYLGRLIDSEKAENREMASKVAVLFPNQEDRGTHVNISGGGVVKTSKNPQAAVKFLNFLLTPKAQEILAKGNDEYPVIKDVSLAQGIAGLGTFKEDIQPSRVLGPLYKQAIGIAEQGGWK
jgi:iron(III) transport system substrate-binding protein